MKALVINFIFINLLVSCKKENDIFDFENPSVEKFIELVKNDKYDFESLPSLAPNDIPTILNSANDFTEIKIFPVSPLSSYYPEHLTIGECLLWTIESIRVFYDVDNSVNNCPSLVPKIRVMNNDNQPFLDENNFIQVYNLYKNWWYVNADKDFGITRNINPLESTNYKWK